MKCIFSISEKINRELKNKRVGISNTYLFSGYELLYDIGVNTTPPATSSSYDVSDSSLYIHRPIHLPLFEIRHRRPNPQK